MQDRSPKSVSQWPVYSATLSEGSTSGSFTDVGIPQVSFAVSEHFIQFPSFWMKPNFPEGVSTTDPSFGDCNGEPRASRNASLRELRWKKRTTPAPSAAGCAKK